METKHDLHDFLTHNEPASYQGGRRRWFKLLLIILAAVLLLAGFTILAF